MDGKKLTEKGNTPNKPMQTYLYEAVHGIRGHTSSPFRCSSSNFSTPPSRFPRIRNPFEQHLIERLHLPTFSPTVFAQVSTPKTENKFKWTIEDISNLKPADIDETTLDQHETNDYAMEMTAQEKINTFFNEKEIVPSPMNQITKTTPFIGADNPSNAKKTFVHDATQTMLTLPPKLPKHVENILMPYFNYDTQQSLNNSPNSKLYRQLFESEDIDKSCSDSVQTSPALSIGLLSPIQMSPPLEKHDVQSNRNFGSPVDPLLQECNLSPIGTENDGAEAPVQCTAQLNFTENMSVDSFHVPDTCGQLPSIQNDYFEWHSPVKEVLSDTSINWDMEYKQVSLVSPTRDNKMDVSNSNTPRSKSILNRRKKALSNSFRRIDIDDENKENHYDQNVCIKNNSFNCGDATDFGYQTGSLTMSDNWPNSHLFASTPSKNKH